MCGDSRNTKSEEREAAGRNTDGQNIWKDLGFNTWENSAKIQ